MTLKAADEKLAADLVDARIAIDIDKRTLRLYGVEYAIEIFAMLGLGPIGSSFQIIERKDGVLTLKRLP